MAFQIRVSTDALRKASEEIRALSNENEDVYEQMKTLCVHLEEAWSGAAGQQVVDVMHELIKPINNGKEGLDESARMLNDIAQGFESIDGGEVAFKLMPINPNIFVLLKCPRPMIELKLSSGHIRVVPEQLREISEQCKPLADTIENIGNRIESILHGLQNDWEGRAYNRFSENITDIIHFYRELSHGISEIADKIVFAANRYEEIDSMLG